MAPTYFEPLLPLAAPLYPKLMVGDAQDPAERAADAFADRVMGGGGAAPAAPMGTTGSGVLRRKCSACEEEDKTLHRKEAAGAGGDGGRWSAPPVVHQALASAGHGLDAGARAQIEARGGVDLSGVRVHTDALAAESAAAVGARAYTVGRDVVFGAGQYRPGTSDGLRLIAHEVGHLGSGVVRRSGQVRETVIVEEWDVDAAINGGPMEYVQRTLNLSWPELHQIWAGVRRRNQGRLTEDNRFVNNGNTLTIPKRVVRRSTVTDPPAPPPLSEDAKKVETDLGINAFAPSFSGTEALLPKLKLLNTDELHRVLQNASRAQREAIFGASWTAVRSGDSGLAGLRLRLTVLAQAGAWEDFDKLLEHAQANAHEEPGRSELMSMSPDIERLRVLNAHVPNTPRLPHLKVTPSPMSHCLLLPTPACFGGVADSANRDQGEDSQTSVGLSAATRDRYPTLARQVDTDQRRLSADFDSTALVHEWARLQYDLESLAMYAREQNRGELNLLENVAELVADAKKPTGEWSAIFARATVLAAKLKKLDIGPWMEKDVETIRSVVQVLRAYNDLSARYQLHLAEWAKYHASVRRVEGVLKEVGKAAVVAVIVVGSCAVAGCAGMAASGVYAVEIVATGVATAGMEAVDQLATRGRVDLAELVNGALVAAITAGAAQGLGAFNKALALRALNPVGLLAKGVSRAAVARLEKVVVAVANRIADCVIGGAMGHAQNKSREECLKGMAMGAVLDAGLAVVVRAAKSMKHSPSRGRVAEGAPGGSRHEATEFAARAEKTGKLESEGVTTPEAQNEVEHGRVRKNTDGHVDAVEAPGGKHSYTVDPVTGCPVRHSGPGVPFCGVDLHKKLTKEEFNEINETARAKFRQYVKKVVWVGEKGPNQGVFRVTDPSGKQVFMRDILKPRHIEELEKLVTESLQNTRGLDRRQAAEEARKFVAALKNQPFTYVRGTRPVREAVDYTAEHNRAVGAAVTKDAPTHHVHPLSMGGTHELWNLIEMDNRIGAGKLHDKVHRLFESIPYGGEGGTLAPSSLYKRFGNRLEQGVAVVLTDGQVHYMTATEWRKISGDARAQPP